MTSFTSGRHIAELGERLESNRLQQNIPQTELAKKAGISTRTLRRLESGEGGSLDSFVRLLMALGIDGNLAVLIPDASVRPMERSGADKSERMRASRKQASTSKSKDGWRWGDESS